MARHVPVLQKLTYLKPGKKINLGWTEESPRPREWEDLYRRRWGHDKIIRSTHGVNCTGSCSWKIYVKDGIITWETQQTDYPSLGPNFPEYEPRGCPRGASYSWYIYSPVRVRYPYVREELLELWRNERDAGHDPVSAWANIVSDRQKVRQYQRARGKGGLVRSSWNEVTEIIAASMVHTIKTYGPDRITGFSPIPAMSMVSYASGSRLISLLGGTMLSFYDWYADLPPASPQIWGEQTDVPESADWYNSKYFIIWGTNLPMTRTPDAHFMVEARYNGTKIVGVSPDYAEYVKFADLWLPCKAGTDSALAMAMTHVILKEFYVDKQTKYFFDYAKKYTDLPFLVTLRAYNNGYVSDRFLNAKDLGLTEQHAEWKMVMWDEVERAPAVPNGSIGYRWDTSKKWNLKLETANGTPIHPALSFFNDSDDVVLVHFPHFTNGTGETFSRGVPVKRLWDADGNTLYVTTVLDIMMANAGVGRGLPGDYPMDYDDPLPYTPAWQEAITGVNRNLAIRVAREFADNAERTKGRSMIAMGAGTNHWYHSDMTYRTMLNLVLLTGCQGVNGGGWAHYVGQEKVRPLEGWSMVAFAGDWMRPPRLQNGTSYYYFMTDQHRYEDFHTETIGSPLGGRFHKMHPADMIAMATRLGWQPFYPQFRENTLELVQEAKEAGAETDEEIVSHVVERIKTGDVRFAVEEPDNPRNYPRVFINWRSNLLGASGKGHEYFVKHFMGADGHPLGNENTSWKPETVDVTNDVPDGKVDLFVNIDFRMSSSNALYADIVLPAATWYEKYDLSSTDMHPFIHPFNPAITHPWETRSDWDAFRAIARTFSDLAKDHLPAMDDIVLRSLGHDAPTEISAVGGKVLDWRNGEVEAIPGKTMPDFSIVRRDFPNVYHQMTTLGPLAQEQISSKGISFPGDKAYQEILEKVGPSKAEGVFHGRPSLEHDQQVVEAILTYSGASNGHRSVDGWKALGEMTGIHLSAISEGCEEVSYSLGDITTQPRVSLPTAVWSGLEQDGRRYSPFVVNVEYGVPWRTLTGRQHFYLDHEMMLDFGEGLPLFRPPLGGTPFTVDDSGVPENGKAIMVRYLTPHQKWGFHTTYTDNPKMMTLFRGGQVIWINDKDAKKIDVKDNDWVEVYNRNGVIACRAVVSYRLPEGVAMMYHAQDRTIAVPGTTITKDRGGTHNSVTRVIPKPTHLIGGYAQLSFGFNYYGPCGHNRDAVTFIRRMKEVNWLES
ncbi:nitrate reductase subunit alpha [Alicyclobacillus mengziensis]|uniref:nitrate reductase (quinone) n=1 Tax=Alicyclobacillus mengziensis TaxID=2931921 RepID=A0A9X7VUR3_9BACL|nr:nitrate reductase subunit alpha [Alicyclobacillus mengziensis]QSO45579.1 nitrate reductase subunit alpha [Alicyclobacillus mengziensis]